MMGAEVLCSTFPYYLAVDEQMVIQQAGPTLRRLMPHMIIGASTLAECFKVIPLIMTLFCESGRCILILLTQMVEVVEVVEV
jgi:hypothetical protein